MKVDINRTSERLLLRIVTQQVFIQGLNFNYVFVEEVETGQVVKRCLLDFQIFALSCPFVKVEDWFLVFEMQTKSAKLVSYLANQLCHSLDVFLWIFLVVECLDQIRNKFLLDDFHVKPLQHAQDPFDGLDANIVWLVVKKFLDLRQIDLLKSRGALQLLMVLQKVFLYPNNAVHSDFVIHVLTDVLELLDYNFNLTKTLFSYVLADSWE